MGNKDHKKLNNILGLTSKENLQAENMVKAFNIESTPETDIFHKMSCFG